MILLNYVKKYLTKENVYFMFLFFFSISIPFSNHIANDLMTLTLLVWIFTVKKRFEKDWLVYSMGLLSVAFIVSAAVNWGHIPTEYIKKHSVFIKEVFSLITPFIWFLVVRSASISRKKILILITSFSTAVWVATIIQLVFNPLPYSPTSVNRLSFYYNPNFTSGLIAFSCIALLWMILIYKNIYFRGLLTVMFVVNTIGLYLTFSRGAWLGLFLSLLLLFMFHFIFQFNKRTLLISAVILCVLVSSFFLMTKLSSQDITATIMHSADNDISNGRAEIWNTALRIAHISPCFGVGPKMFKSYYLKTSPLASIPGTLIQIHAHNNFLQLLAEMGLFGLISFILLDVLLLYRAYRLLKDSEKKSTYYMLSMILLGWLLLWNIHGLFDYTFGLKFYTTPILFLFGLLLSERRSKTNLLTVELKNEIIPGKN